MKFIKSPLFIAAAILVASAVGARADVDADITAITTNASTVFGTVKTLVISVAAFWVLMKFVKQIKKA